jgi:hypothetical protein
MTLAIVQFGVAIVMALIISWTSLLVAVSLMLPDRAERSERALETAPRRCAGYGAIGAVLVAVSIAAVRAPFPLIKLLAIVLLLALGAALVVGGAGIARLMGKRIGEMSGARTSFGSLVRGGVAYSAAMLFPLLGWYLFLPISSLFALGAGMIALRPQRRAVYPALSTEPDPRLQGA